MPVQGCTLPYLNACTRVHFTLPKCLYKGALYLTSVPVQWCTLPFFTVTYSSSDQVKKSEDGKCIPSMEYKKREGEDFRRASCILRIRADSHYASLFLSVTFPFRHHYIIVPSEWSVFKLSVVFIHLPKQHVIGGLRLFPSNMQPTATDCIFRYLLIIRTSVINRMINKGHPCTGTEALYRPYGP